MSERLSRQEMKRDEFREAVGKAVDYAGSHARLLVIGAVAVVVVALAGVGVYTWLEAREADAALALNQAIEVYGAPVDEADPQPEADDPTFASEDARRAAARDRFQQVYDQYGGTDPGRVALVYLGRIALAEGDPGTARDHWRTFLDQTGDHLVAGEVRLNLVHLERHQGQLEQVAQELEDMLDAREPVLPGDVVLFELGETYEEMGREQDALNAYQRLVQEYQVSPYTQEARQRLGALGGGGGVTTTRTPLGAPIG